MTRVTKIARLKHPGVFRDFSWPADLPAFGRYNLIYGWNGSGKTTLSELFRALERRQIVDGVTAVVTIDGHGLAQDQFDQSPVEVRVFNRNFVQQSVFPSGGGDVPPIFVIGPENAEKQKEADQLKNQLEKALSTVTEATTVAGRAKLTLEQHCENAARTIKEALRSSGVNPYNNYDKRGYRRTIRDLQEGQAELEQLDDDSLDALRDHAKGAPLPKLASPNMAFPDLDVLSDRVRQVCGREIVSSVIESLRGDVELADWVRSGLHVHKSRSSTTCLFCEQDLPDDRVLALEAHFSDEYERLMKDVEVMRTLIQKARLEPSLAALPRDGEFYPELKSKAAEARAELTITVERYTEALRSLEKILDEKQSNPFGNADVSTGATTIDKSSFDRFNQLIEEHNTITDEFTTRAESARRRLELDAVSSELGNYDGLSKALDDATISEETTKAEVERLRREIARLETEIIEHREPAEELNKDLEQYLGHGDLKLEVKDTGYMIVRNGVVADALSEGEMTAIALLYFLKSLRDRRFDATKGVVVLDDPVSSLDANALYLAFAFIRERTKDAAQLIIPTHNFTMFRQVRNWFHHLPGQKKKNLDLRPARFYMLECLAVDGQRHSNIAPLDPLLEQFQSEYHYLFATVYRHANNQGDQNLEANYLMPNVARRLLEAFLAFRQPNISGELWQKLSSIDFDEAKKVRIIRFTHTYSHGDVIEEPDHNLSVLSETNTTLKELLELMESEDQGHYQSMVQLVQPSQEDGEEAA